MKFLFHKMFAETRKLKYVLFLLPILEILSLNFSSAANVNRLDFLRTQVGSLNSLESNRESRYPMHTVNEYIHYTIKIYLQFVIESKNKFLNII